MTKDGLGSYCKVCMKTYVKGYVQTPDGKERRRIAKPKASRTIKKPPGVKLEGQRLICDGCRKSVCVVCGACVGCVPDGIKEGCYPARTHRWVM